MTDVVTDPFESLLTATELGTKAPKDETLKWSGPIPATATKYAEALLTKNEAGEYDKKAVVKTSSKDTANQLAAAVRAAVEAVNTDVSLTARHIHDKDGNLTSVSLTVGERRGRKASA